MHTNYLTDDVCVRLCHPIHLRQHNAVLRYLLTRVGLDLVRDNDGQVELARNLVEVVDVEALQSRKEATVCVCLVHGLVACPLRNA